MIKTKKNKRPTTKAKTRATGPAIRQERPATRERLGFRINEWAALTGMSPVTVWRRIADGTIPVVKHGPTKIIPRTYAIRMGYISE